MEKLSIINKLPAFIQQRLIYLCEKDFSSLSDLLDEDLKYVHATGIIHNKEEYLRFIQQRINITAARIENFTCIQSSESCILLGTLIQTFQRAGESHSIEAHSSISEIWLNRNGWKLYSFQSTRIEQ